MNQEMELKTIADAVSNCKKCELFHSREKGVPGEGPPDAEIMFIGEGPGFHENMQGRPFVGAAGEPQELRACNPYLEKQLQIINPKVVVTLGRFSMAKFIPNAKISEVHGQPMKVKGMLVIPFFHPAAALHRQSLRPVVEEDFAKLPELIKGAAQTPEYQPEEQIDDDNQAEQLSMF